MTPRRLLEILSRKVVLRRRLPEDFKGLTLYVSPGAQLKYWKRDIVSCDRMLFDVAKLLIRPGDVVWDIGSNVGVFALAASACAGREGQVYAYEADVWLARLILRSAGEVPMDCSPVSVVPVAVSESFGFAEFAIAKRGRASNFLLATGGASMSGGSRETYKVLTVGLNQMATITGAPNVIKMDIEGAEMLALGHAREALLSSKPRILCEVNRSNCDAFTEFFHGLGYCLFDMEKALAGQPPLEKAVANTLLIHRDDTLCPKAG